MTIFDALGCLIEIAEGELADKGYLMTVSLKHKIRDSIKLVRKFKTFIAEVCK